MIHLLNLVFQSGLDLNVERQTYDLLRSGAKGWNTPGQARVFSAHGLPSHEHVWTVCCQASRRSQGQGFLLPGPVLRHGLSLPDDFAQHVGQCKRHPSMADLCGLCAASDWHRQAPVCRGTAGIDLDAAVYAFDASTIDLCISLHPWAPFRSIKLHTLLDLHGSIPSFIHITDGKTHEVNVLDDLLIEAGAFYLMDRGYLDFSRLYVIHQAQAFFVTRAKSNTQFRRRYSNPVDRGTIVGLLRSDWCAHGVLFQQGLSGGFAPGRGQGRERQTHHVSNQQLCLEAPNSLQSCIASAGRSSCSSNGSSSTCASRHSWAPARTP
jgi:hypothetical protein